jgi:hypothetical protein
MPTSSGRSQWSCARIASWLSLVTYVRVHVATVSVHVAVVLGHAIALGHVAVSYGVCILFTFQPLLSRCGYLLTVNPLLVCAPPSHPHPASTPPPGVAAWMGKGGGGAARRGGSSSDPTDAMLTDSDEPVGDAARRSSVSPPCRGCGCDSMDAGANGSSSSYLSQLLSIYAGANRPAPISVAHPISQLLYLSLNSTSSLSQLSPCSSSVRASLESRDSDT